MVFWKRAAKGDDIRDIPTPNSGGRPKLKAAFTNELRASVRLLEDTNENRNAGLFGLIGSSKKSPFRPGGRPKLSKEQKDELQASVHKIMAKRQLVEFRETTSPPVPVEKSDTQQQPAVDQDLRVDQIDTNQRPTLIEDLPVDDIRPPLNQNLPTDEINLNQHHNLNHDLPTGAIDTNQRPTLNHDVPTGETNAHQRPTLNQDFADELHSSFRRRESRNESRRQEIKKRMMERRESKRLLESQFIPPIISEEDEHEIATDSPHRSPRAKAQATLNKSGERPPLRPDLFDELRKSIHSRSTRNFDRRQEIKERLMKRRDSQRIVSEMSGHSQSSFASFGEGHESFANDIAAPKSALRGREGKKTTWDLSGHSTNTFAHASFSDIGDTEHEPAFTPAVSMQQSGTNVEGVDKSGASRDTVKSEYLRVLKENKRLKNEETLNMKKVAVLTQQIEDLKAEGTDLRKQLSAWQEKTSMISRRQSQDRQKYENSSEMIAKARLDLTKTLNENIALKSSIHNLQLQAEGREATIRSLNETIEGQFGKLSSLSAQLKDTESELRFYANEKRRIEEELTVLMASQEGGDISEVIRRLEQDKARWLEEKERTLEAKRIALDEESNRILQREKQKYEQESEQKKQMTVKAKVHNDEHKKIQDAINKQIKEMKDVNDDLRDKFNNEQTENRLEIRRKDHTIGMLEQEISKLRRKLAASQLKEQDLEAQLADIQNKNNELDDARRQISVLEKQIKNTKKEAPQQKQDWKEIVLPGYKHLRGVTFGTPSEELAGFLTILVEDQKAKQAEALTQLQKEVKKYLKDVVDGGGSGRKKSTGSKSTAALKDLRKKSSAKKRGPIRKRKKDESTFTDIEDYDWAAKPKNVRKESKRALKEEISSSSDDSSTYHRPKRRRKIEKKKKILKSSSKKVKSRTATKKKASRLKKKNDSKPIHRHHKRKAERPKISRHRQIDDNYTREQKNIGENVPIDLDDVSLVVVKRIHTKKSKNKAGTSDSLLRFQTIVPPEMIILQ